MLAKTLVRRQDTIPLRIMNLSDTSKAIQSGITVGKWSPVDEVITVSNNSKGLEGSESLPDHVKELFDIPSFRLMLCKGIHKFFEIIKSDL